MKHQEWYTVDPWGGRNYPKHHIKKVDQNMVNREDWEDLLNSPENKIKFN